MFFKKSKKILSIDIGHDAIKILLTTGLLEKDFEILDYRYLYTNNLGKALGLTESLQALQPILDELKGNFSEVRMTVSGKDVIARIIEIQAIDDKDIKKVVGLQLERFIPLNPNEVVFDCVPIEDANVRVGFRKCMLIAIPNKIYKNLTTKLHEISINPILMDSEPTAVINSYLAFSQEFEESNNLSSITQTGVAILHIGASHSDMLVLKGKVPIMCRPISGGISSVINIIMNQFDKSYLDAAEMLIRLDGEDPKITTDINNFIDNLTREAKNSLVYCSREYDIPIERIYITGGVAHNEHICQMIAEKIKTEVYRFNPFEGLDLNNFSNQISDFESKASAFIPVLGLAIREINI